MAQKIESQRTFWDAQHKMRGTSGEEGNTFLHIPNQSAVEFAAFLPNQSNILELGCANGRDARWLATLGHHIIAVDFSQVALDQMMEIAKKQCVDQQIIPLWYDFSSGALPTLQLDSLDGFYARSSLHADEQKLYLLFSQVTAFLKPDGIILIEGKDEGDPKIRASRLIANNLAINLDEGGHIRHVWNPQYLLTLCEMFYWEPIRLTESEDLINKEASLIRLIARKSPRHYDCV